MDDLAEQLGIDPLEFRHRNALARGDTTATGQELVASAGLRACLDALRPHWTAHARGGGSASTRPRIGRVRRGVGIGCMWYGIGNTSLSNPSTMRRRLARRRHARPVLNGAIDIGQGSTTILPQIAADALGVPVALVERVGPATPTSPPTPARPRPRARRSCRATRRRLAGEDLRRQILALAKAGPDATLELDGGAAWRRADGDDRHRSSSCASCRSTARDCVVLGRGHLRPADHAARRRRPGRPVRDLRLRRADRARSTSTLELGTVKVRRIVAAHDVGRAINPTLVEGQIQGGIAQGLGMALMEEYVPGRTDNLHDYLIPTIGDAPEIECLLIEDAEPAGPFGAKGVGEPALVPTAPAILAAIRHATGARIDARPGDAVAGPSRDPRGSPARLKVEGDVRTRDPGAPGSSRRATGPFPSVAARGGRQRPRRLPGRWWS